MVAARKINPSLVTQESGTITQREGQAFRVELGSGLALAERAVSCLVAPMEGDRVLVAVEASGKAYILAIFERRGGDQKTRISVDGDLEIRTPSGSCLIASSERVTVASPGEVKIAAGDLNISALQGKIVTEKLSFVAKWMLSELGKVKILGETIDSVVERVSSRVERSYRTVTEVDQVKAHQMDYQAEEQIRMHAKNTIVTSDNLVKVDGDQIHFG